jgi:hypothetical protein
MAFAEIDSPTSDRGSPYLPESTIICPWESQAIGYFAISRLG